MPSSVGRRKHCLEGTIPAVSVADLLQLVGSSGRSWEIRLRFAEVDGRLGVVNTRLVYANFGLLCGEAALVEILAAEEGEFCVGSLPDDFEQTLDGSWQMLLLDAFRVLDERNRTPSCAEPPEARPAQSRAPSPSIPPKLGLVGSEHAAELVDQGFCELRKGNRALAHSLWSRALASDPENRTIRTNLRRLETQLRR